jgi:hypothetical protein
MSVAGIWDLLSCGGGSEHCCHLRGYNVEEVLPRAYTARGVMVIDNLTAHKGERVRENWSSSRDESYSVLAALLS